MSGSPPAAFDEMERYALTSLKDLLGGVINHAGGSWPSTSHAAP